MVEHIYVVCSEWGGSKGGINVFNRLLVEALARVVRKDVHVHSVVDSVASIPTTVGSSFDFLTYGGTADTLAATIEDDLSSGVETRTGIVIIGHDVHTGPHAIGARDLLRGRQYSCRAGVICHMDYAAYQPYKANPLTSVTAKAEEQRKVIRAADCVYAVGPLLRMAFERLRDSSGASTPIHEIIPGFPEAMAKREGGSPSTAIKFFFSGRVDAENDRIKNGRLALRAIYRAYENTARSPDPRWRQRGTFAVFGAMDGVDQDWFCEGLDRRELGNRFLLSFEKFTEQEVMFGQLMDSHVALGHRLINRIQMREAASLMRAR